MIDTHHLPILCRDMPKAITIGISLTTVCYLMVNVAYITVLGKAGILKSDAVAVVSRCRNMLDVRFFQVGQLGFTGKCFKDANTNIFNT